MFPAGWQADIGCKGLLGLFWIVGSLLWSLIPRSLPGLRHRMPRTLGAILDCLKSFYGIPFPGVFRGYDNECKGLLGLFLSDCRLLWHPVPRSLHGLRHRMQRTSGAVVDLSISKISPESHSQESSQAATLDAKDIWGLLLVATKYNYPCQESSKPQECPVEADRQSYRVLL